MLHGPVPVLTHRAGFFVDIGSQVTSLLALVLLFLLVQALGLVDVSLLVVVRLVVRLDVVHVVRLVWVDHGLLLPVRCRSRIHVADEPLPERPGVAPVAIAEVLQPLYVLDGVLRPAGRGGHDLDQQVDPASRHPEPGKHEPLRASEDVGHVAPAHAPPPPSPSACVSALGFGSMNWNPASIRTSRPLSTMSLPCRTA